MFKFFLFHRYRWDQVGNAVFKRYPNPWSKHVLSEDVVSREVEGPILKSIRIITKQNKVPLPKFVSKVIASFYSRGVFRTLSNILSCNIFSKIVNEFQSFTIFAKKLHHRCLSGF